MTNPVSAAMNIVKLVRLADLLLDVFDETSISIDDVVEMRAKAKREGRDHLSEDEMAELSGKAQAAIDDI